MKPRTLISGSGPHRLETRRGFILRAGGLLAGARCAKDLLCAEASTRPRARVLGYSACSWTLRDSSPGVFDVAAKIGLDGVELDMGGPPELRLAKKDAREEYKAAAKKAGLRVSSLALACLNNFPLASDPRAPGWVAEAIDAAADFGVRVVLLAFFGKGELKSRKEMDRVGDILKELAPAAEGKNVRLGLENTLSARQDLSIIERAGSSPALAVYYDVGNARHWKHDSLTEIPFLGARICGVHFKDGVKSYGDAMLGQGKVDYPGVARVLHGIGYTGWIVLEPHGRDLVADMKANLAFARRTMA